MAQRSILGSILKNFLNSFKIAAKPSGKLVASDFIGNKYYEVPADPQGGKRRPTRWFDPATKDDFEQEIPAEWEAWLRNRRAEPPTEDEIKASYALMLLKKKNAAALELKNPTSLPNQPIKGMESFPQYGDEYELMAGKKKNGKDK
ncbi:NADH dehydrogenase [ubiquinone] 1 alpha subcomplex assembly factor 2 isoform X2 [Neocloeon triangulifer]|uniref:NADH dehydrogenase [ubiquinone] 1 alpha subcomplex assembly factor 2 isoform X2 n=1 Tax=Neocloeon triangulifer TaxID=2078957 RepID=UPI00286EC726|nr:NADH dehydrogenase [ubiquinone] 1 alpha subcomplex assembly factor 2 isoform X2 [Neocloeon triangulifer]XP_059473663.1 NADH dehydrogenase [ubiquinone] 1 alpha subcomplex assembly factor 2 isoform X2 [Neocloeon triangulifer]